MKTGGCCSFCSEGHRERFRRLLGVSLDIGKNCTVSLFFEQAYLSQWGVLPRYTAFSGI
ncbi:hypothetical protein YB04_004112 [Salmonella enterica subsp. enterica]|nr:hypothetical protein [Salmonella enterica subsp. enterica]